MANSTRTTGGLVKMGITVSPEQLEGLTEAARDDQVSVAAIVRMAIRHELERRAQEKRVRQRRAS